MPVIENKKFQHHISSSKKNVINFNKLYSFLLKYFGDVLKMDVNSKNIRFENYSVKCNLNQDLPVKQFLIDEFNQKKVLKISLSRFDSDSILKSIFIDTSSILEIQNYSNEDSSEKFKIWETMKHNFESVFSFNDNLERGVFNWDFEEPKENNITHNQNINITNPTAPFLISNGSQNTIQSKNISEKNTTNFVEGDQIYGNVDKIIKDVSESQIATDAAQISINKSETFFESLSSIIKKHPLISCLIIFLLSVVILGFLYFILKDIPFSKLQSGNNEIKFK
jgi:hypothetical protein